MNQRAVTWGDILRHRSGSRFVGRRHEVEAFRLNCLYDVPQSLIFAIQGPPGIGKTELMRQYGVVAQEHGVVTAAISCGDIFLTGRFAIIEVMAALAQQLGQAGVPLTTFQEVLGDYRSILLEMDRAKASGSSAGGPSAKAEPLPGYLWALFGGLEDQDEWVQRAWDEYLVSSVPVRQSRLVRDPVAALTERFVQDLNAWATVRRIVLGFDDWHLIPPPFDAWLQDLLVQGEMSTNIWFLLAGREPLSRGWERLAPVTLAVDLSSLSRTDSRALLLAHDVTHTAALEERLEAGDGNPFALVSLAEIPGELLPGGGLPSTEQDAAVTRYLVHLKPNWRELFRKCAAARRIDAQVLAVLLNGTSLDGLLAAADGAGENAVASLGEESDSIQPLLDFLQQSPLIVRSKSGLHFHPAATAPVSRWAQKASDQVWLGAHQRLFAYYRQRLELYNGERRYLDATWQRDQSEALYHSLVIADLVASTGPQPAVEDDTEEPDLPERLLLAVEGPGSGPLDTALNAALLSFSQALLRFSPWSGNVVRVWREAARICDPVGPVAAWLAEVEALYAALLAGDWERSLRLLDAFLTAIGRWQDQGAAGDAVVQQGWSPDLLQSLRTLRQLTASRLALPPEPELPVDLLAGNEPAELSEVTPGAGSRASQTAADDETTTCAFPPDQELTVLSQAVPDGKRAVGQARSEQEGQESSPKKVEAGEGAQVEASAVEHCSYANARLDGGDYESAIQAYDQALALNPAYVAAYYNRGLAYARMGALDRALADFSRVIELDDTQSAAYHQRGLAHARRGAFERAVTDFNAALAAGSPSLPILYARANAHFRLSAYERAIADYSEVLRQDDSRVDALLNRGLARAATGNHLEALRDYNRAIALDPKRAIAYNYRGQAHVQLDRHAEALADYEHAIGLDPRNATIHNNRGLLYMQIEAYPQAIESYQQAMALQPDWATPYYNAACAAALLGDVERASVWLSRAVALRDRYRAMAQTDPDFAQIRETAQFRSIVTHHRAGAG